MLYRLMAVLLLLVPATAHADWYEASTGHFTVYSSQRPQSLKAFASELERFDKAIRLMRGFADPAVAPANRITVYVVGDTDDVAELAGERFVAGFYVPRAGGSLAIVPRSSGSGSELDLSPQAILLHEYSHHLMWSITPDTAYPSWFVEGFAEFHATAIFEKDGSVFFGNPPLYRAETLMRGNALPAQKLLMADSLKLNDAQREGLYARGWLLTHYLSTQPERKSQLKLYIRAINAGKLPIEAATEFGDFKTLDRDLERYKLTRFNGVRVFGKNLVIPEPVLRKLTPGESATMGVRIRSKNGVGEKTAPRVYQAAKKAAAPYPDDRGAQLVLAEAAFDAGDYAAAEAAADRALAADPKSIDGYVYKAKARMALAEKAADKRPETWSAIRRIIAAGNRLDADDPEPLILYYTSFEGAGQKPSELAMDGLHRAFELAPQDVGLRLTTAIMYLRIENKDMARALLAPLAYQAHRKGLSELAAKAVARIDAGDPKGALAAIEGGKDEGEDSPPPAG